MMSRPPNTRLVDDLRRASPHHLALRAMVVLGTAVNVASASLSAGKVIVPATIILGVVAVWCALFPDTNVGLLLVAGLVWHWGGVVHAFHTPLVLPGAAGLLLAHVGMAMAATTPTVARWSPATVGRWTRRVGIVTAMIVVAWSITLAAHAIDLDGGAGVLVVAVLLVAATALTLRARSVASTDG